MDNWLLFAAGGVFFLFIAAYLVIMFLWPEWVGITGKVALEAERAHRGDNEPQPDVLDALHQTPQQISAQPPQSGTKKND